MVLTRAQRAQTKATPPASPPKSGILKKAATRRTKKPEPEEVQEKPATKTTRVTKAAAAAATATATAKAATEPKDEILKSSSSRTTSARTATATGTTKASAARAAAAPKTASTKAAALRATATKASAAKTVVTKSTTTTRKAAPASRTARKTKAAKITPTEEPAVDDDKATIGASEDQQNIASVEEQKAIIADTHENGQTQPESPAPVAEESQHDAVVAATSPTKLPRPTTAATQPVSPFKMSLLSSTQGLGSVRKPPVSGALFNSPSKAVPVLQSATNPFMSTSPVRMTTSVRDFATVLGSPRRPVSSGSDNSACSRASTPKRPHADENASQTSLKRLRTSMSMPSLGSPQRSQSLTSGSPPSPTKSSMRSPEKRPNISPKKVSWHQTPPRPAVMQEETPSTKAPGILDGCIFFLDVNSLTGSNQNSLFAGLIDELGGQCVEHWTHNNMGITHVLFMNGEMRTLEKVLASNGEVFCVSLGWLLDCQRENLRIPENQPRYLIDLNHVPGHTPKPNRSALNTPTTARSAAPVSHTPALPPPKWALPTTPSAPREPLGALSSSLMIKTPAFLAAKHATPAPPPSVGMGTINEHDKENVSPVSDATPLMQKTCPPKQLNKSILAMSTGISATPLRNKFLTSKRRKSFDGIQKPAMGGLQSPPRRPLGLGSPKRQTSPLKKSVNRP